MLYPQLRSLEKHCTTCGQTTRHLKTGTNHGLHFLTAFLSFMLWAPVWIGFMIVDALRKYHCVVCEPPKEEDPSGEIGKTEPKAEKRGPVMPGK